MTKDTFWIFVSCLATVAVLTESVLPEHLIYVTDALSQNAFVIKTWTFNDSRFYITVKKGTEILLFTFLDGVSFYKFDDRLLIQDNSITKERSLLLNNVTRSDEGLYQISTYDPTMFEIMDNKWNFQLTVLEPGEIKQGHIGENILITEMVQESIVLPRLYHTDQLITVVRGSDCGVSTNSPFYDRIRCSKDKAGNTIRIELKNVTENDNGLYKLITEDRLTWRCFLNITGTYTKSTSVTPPDHLDENNSDQPSNITLSTTVNSSTVMHLPRLNQHIAQDECDPGLYLTRIASEPPLTVPTCQERKTDNSNIAQNKNIDPCTGSIHMAQIISMDRYEVVDISNEDPEITPELEEIIHESTENCITPSSDTSGYLTVLGRRETTV